MTQEQSQAQLRAAYSEAVALLKTGRAATAERQLRAIQAAGPGEVSSLHLLGAALLYQDKVGEAVEVAGARSRLAAQLLAGTHRSGPRLSRRRTARRGPRGAQARRCRRAIARGRLARLWRCAGRAREISGREVRLRARPTGGPATFAASSRRVRRSPRTTPRRPRRSFAISCALIRLTWRRSAALPRSRSRRAGRRTRFAC